MNNTRHPLAMYLRYGSASAVRETRFGARAGFRQKIDSIDMMLSADLFRADVCHRLFYEMSPRSRKRVTFTPNDYLRRCFGVRFREYCQLVSQQPIGSGLVVEWVRNHGAEEITRCRLGPEVLAIWEEVTRAHVLE